MDMKAAVDSLSALAHAGRLGIFRLLVRAGPDGVAAGEIARRLEIRPSTLSAHLNILSHAALIDARRHGRSIVYSARYGAMGELLAFLTEDCCGGVPQICAPLAEALGRVACCPVDAPTVLEDAR